MLKRLVIALSAALISCTPGPGPMSGDPNPATGPGSDQVNYWRQKAAADRAACRNAMMQARRAGVSPVVAGQQFIACNQTVAEDARHASELDIQRTSPIAADTLKIDTAARAATRQGRTDEALALYRQIDANGPAIIAEVRKQTPNGISVTRQNSLPDNLHRMDMLALLQELATAQRMIGLSYEHAGNNRIAADWYEKANSTMATLGGRDGVASIRLGFMYAWGRGVPQNRERALQLFGGEGTTTFWSGLLGGQQKGESELAYLLRKNELPRRPEEVTPEYINAVMERDVSAHLEALNELMEMVNSDKGENGFRSHPAPDWGCIGTFGGSSASFGAVDALGGRC